MSPIAILALLAILGGGGRKRKRKTAPRKVFVGGGVAFPAVAGIPSTPKPLVTQKIVETHEAYGTPDNHPIWVIASRLPKGHLKAGKWRATVAITVIPTEYSKAPFRDAGPHAVPAVNFAIEADASGNITSIPGASTGDAPYQSFSLSSDGLGGLDYWLTIPFALNIADVRTTWSFAQ